jgi:hypothetical protein
VMQVDGATARATQFPVIANSKRSHLVLQMVTGLNGMGYEAKRLPPQRQPPVTKTAWNPNPNT